MRQIRTNVLALTASLALGTAAQASLYSDVVLADNPAGFYQLDEANAASGATDSSTSNKTGTYMNFASSAFGQTGIPGTNGGTAVRFDGNNDWIDTTNKSIGGNDTTYSLEVWVNIGTGTTSSSQYAVSHLRDNEDNRYHALGINASEDAVLSQLQNTTGGSVSGSTALNDDEWHYLAGVFSGDNTADEDKLYVDGQLVNSTDGPSEDGATNRFYIGLLHNRSSGTGYFDGVIDEAAIYDSDLSAEQVLSHYSAGIAVPEPASLALLGLGGLMTLPRRGRKRA